jgi:uncharacterized repeat protein (TIGR03803 family)
MERLRRGGSGGSGTIFAINANGASFTNLHVFTATTSNQGNSPYGGVLLSGNSLYGTTYQGGIENDGTVFVLSLGPIPLDFQMNNGNLILNWGNPAFTIQTATNVVGPYVTDIGAESPYTNTSVNSQAFFRLNAN